MKRSCQNCGGLQIYPPEKKVKYRSDIGGWVCDACYVSLLRQWKDGWAGVFKNLEKQKNDKKDNNK